MYRIFPRVFFFVLAVNVCTFMLMTALSSPQVSDPFTSSANVTVAITDLPNIYNATDNSDTFSGHLASPDNATGAGGNGDPFSFIPDYFEIPYSALYYLFQFLAGGWIFDGISIFGFPDYFISGCEILIMFWAIYTFAYYLLGKG